MTLLSQLEDTPTQWTTTKEEALKDALQDGTLTINTEGIQIGGTAITASASEINLLDGVTATTAELNILDGVTATASELNALDGITATATELNYTDGVTSAIQTQLDAKAASSHTHTKSDLTDVADFLLESEVDTDIKTLLLPANTTISTFGATIVDDADASTARATLGVGKSQIETDLDSDNSSADTAYAPLVLYNTDETPPAASGFPVGTVYIQYTA